MECYQSKSALNFVLVDSVWQVPSTSQAWVTDLTNLTKAHARYITFHLIFVIPHSFSTARHVLECRDLLNDCIAYYAGALDVVKAVVILRLLLQSHRACCGRWRDVIASRKSVNTAYRFRRLSDLKSRFWTNCSRSVKIICYQVSQLYHIYVVLTTISLNELHIFKSTWYFIIPSNI